MYIQQSCCTHTKTTVTNASYCQCYLMPPSLDTPTEYAIHAPISHKSNSPIQVQIKYYFIPYLVSTI